MIRRIAFTCALAAVATASADPKFDQLVSSGSYKEALDYADQNMPPVNRAAADWVKIAESNEKLGLTEKALASYMVSWRLNPKDYASMIGAARIYNSLNEFEQAANLAQKALEVSFTGEASWEYARACIALNKPAEAKQALEKVIATDAGNVVANRELGLIYFTDKQYDKAIALLKIAYDNKPDGDVAYKLGRSNLETGNTVAAIDFLKKTVAAKPDFFQACLDLANAQYGSGLFQDAIDSYTKVDGKTKFSAAEYVRMATACEKVGKNKEAVRAFAKAIPLFGSDKGADAMYARNSVAADALATKNYAGAVEQYLFITAADAKNAQAFFALSEAYAGQNNQPEAMKALEKVIVLDAQNVEAYARLADLYVKSGQQDKAKATFEKMMSLRPSDPSVYLILGDYNRKAKKFAEALDLYVKSNTLQKSAAALDGMAVCAAELGKWEAARDAAESAIVMDAKLLTSRLVLAEALVRAKSFAEAKPHVEIVVEKYPGDAKYLAWLAECYSTLGETDNLAKADRKIVDMDKQNANSRLRLAKYLLGKGDKEGAAVLLRDLTVLTPKEPFVFKNLYQLSSDKGDKGAAIGYMATYLTLNPNDAEAHKNQGDMLYGKKDLDGALNEYRTALKLDPSIKGFYGRYAEIVIAKGQTDEAIKALTGVIGSGEANVGTYQTLGSIYQKKAAFPKAIEMYQKALALEPSNTELLCSMGDCQAASGDLINAVSSYEQAVMMNPKAVNEYKTLGDLYSKQAKNDQAFKAYSKYLEGNPADEAVAKRLAAISFDKKDWAGAVKFLSLVKAPSSDAPDFQYKLGFALFSLEKYQDASVALEKFRAVATPSKDKTTALSMLGVCYEKLNAADKAVLAYDDYCKQPGVKDADASFKRALMREKTDLKGATAIYAQNVTTFPADSRNYLQLGLIYSKDPATLGKSAPMLEKAALNAGKDKTVWLEIAKVYGKLSQADKELDAYKKYIEADPQNIEANVRIGTILMDKNKTTEAMIYLEMANTLSPNNPDVMIKLAAGYVKTNRPKDALTLLQKAKVARKDDVELRKNLFESYVKLGMEKEAVVEVKELVELTHDNKYRLDYARYLLKSGRSKEADDQIEDIAATDPENLEALMVRAEIKRAGKDLAGAIEVYKEISYINANYAPALCERAETHMLENKPQWAQQFYERAMRADPTMAKAVYGLARVAKSRKDNAAYASNLKKAYELDPKDPAIKAEFQSLPK